MTGSVGSVKGLSAHWGQSHTGGAANPISGAPSERIRARNSRIPIAGFGQSRPEVQGSHSSPHIVSESNSSDPGLSVHPAYHNVTPEIFDEMIRLEFTPEGMRKHREKMGAEMEALVREIENRNVKGPKLLPSSLGPVLSKARSSPNTISGSNASGVRLRESILVRFTRRRRNRSRKTLSSHRIRATRIKTNYSLTSQYRIEIG